MPMIPESFDYWGGVPSPRHGAVGRFSRDDELVVHRA
jgi:hypothetical protein